MKKDIRDLIYLNDKIKLKFHGYMTDEPEIFDFYEIADNIISYYKYILLADVLAYFNVDHDFDTAWDYGWNGNTFLKYLEMGDELDNEYIVTLPIPHKINKNTMIDDCNDDPMGFINFVYNNGLALPSNHKEGEKNE